MPILTESSLPDYRIQPLAPHHVRENFDCGETSLNEYLRRYARQNSSRDLSRTFVLIFDNEPNTIAGYFTLSNSHIRRDLLPADLKLPGYPVPTSLLARLAVNRGHQGRGLGDVLLLEVFARVEAMAQQSGIYALEVQALHERAETFYRRFGFQPLADNPLHLYLPLASIRNVLAA